MLCSVVKHLHCRKWLELSRSREKPGRISCVSPNTFFMLQPPPGGSTTERSTVKDSYMYLLNNIFPADTFAYCHHLFARQCWRCYMPITSGDLRVNLASCSQKSGRIRLSIIHVVNLCSPSVSY